MKIVKIINRVLNPVGAQLIRYPSLDIGRRMKLIQHYKINKILDVGANQGRYAMALRKLNYDGEIFSFEPLSKTFSLLKINSNKDKKWIAFNYALGDIDSQTEINIAQNTDSSSLLEMLPLHLKSAPESKYIGTEKIKLRKLDNIFNEICFTNDNILMKIDTQGFEKQVLDGSKKSLSKIIGVQIEMSLRPLYKGQILYLEMIDFFNKNGFSLLSLENGFTDPQSGQLLQVDGLFFRNNN